MVPIIVEDMRSVYIYWLQASPTSHRMHTPRPTTSPGRELNANHSLQLSSSDSARWQHVLDWAHSHLLTTKLLGMGLAAIALITLLAGYQ